MVKIMYDNMETPIELVDISTVKVDQSLSKTEKIIEFVRQLNGDPLHYKCGKFTVNAIHPDDGPTLEECIFAMMK